MSWDSVSSLFLSTPHRTAPFRVNLRGLTPRASFLVDATPNAAVDAATPAVSVAGQNPAAPVFISGAALLSFPVACGVIKFIPFLLHQFFASIKPDDRIIILIASVIVGLMIFLMNTSGANQPKGWREWTVAIFIGLINTSFLMGAAIGIDVAHIFGTSAGSGS